LHVSRTSPIPPHITLIHDDEAADPALHRNRLHGACPIMQSNGAPWRIQARIPIGTPMPAPAI